MPHQPPHDVRTSELESVVPRSKRQAKKLKKKLRATSLAASVPAPDSPRESPVTDASSGATMGESHDPMLNVTQSPASIDNQTDGASNDPVPKLKAGFRNENVNVAFSVLVVIPR
jgi:hypothetical protein